jgi:hypothetical protein
MPTHNTRHDAISILSTLHLLNYCCSSRKLYKYLEAARHPHEAVLKRCPTQKLFDHEPKPTRSGHGRVGSICRPVDSLPRLPWIASFSQPSLCLEKRHLPVVRSTACASTYPFVKDNAAAAAQLAKIQTSIR